MSVYKYLLNKMAVKGLKIKTHILKLKRSQKSGLKQKPRINKREIAHQVFPYTVHVETVVCLKHR